MWSDVSITSLCVFSVNSTSFSLCLSAVSLGSVWDNSYKSLYNLAYEGDTPWKELIETFLIDTDAFNLPTCFFWLHLRQIYQLVPNFSSPMFLQNQVFSWCTFTEASGAVIGQTSTLNRWDSLTWLKHLHLVLLWSSQFFSTFPIT